MSKETFCEGEILYTSKGNTTFNVFDGDFKATAVNKNIWEGVNGTDVKDYENIPFLIMTAEIIEVGFSKQEVKDSNSDSTKKIMGLPISKTFSMGERVFLKVKTLGLIGKKLKVEVRQAVEKQLVDKDQKIEVLSVSEMTVGKIAQSEDAQRKYEATNLRSLENIAMKEMILESKTEDKKKKWKEILVKTTDKKIKLYFHVEVLDAEDEVKYNGDDTNNPKNFSFNKLFELTKGGDCACNRPITKEELKAIAIGATQASIDKHYDGLIKAMEKFKINTCLRISHFLAQVLEESAHLTLTKEGGDDQYLAVYKGWYGRGLIQ